MVLNDLVVSFCYSQKNAALKGLIITTVALRDVIISRHGPSGARDQ